MFVRFDGSMVPKNDYVTAQLLNADVVIASDGRILKDRREGTVDMMRMRQRRKPRRASVEEIEAADVVGR